MRQCVIAGKPIARKSLRCAAILSRGKESCRDSALSGGYMLCYTKRTIVRTRYEYTRARFHRKTTSRHWRYDSGRLMLLWVCDFLTLGMICWIEENNGTFQAIVDESRDGLSNNPT